jgi:HK97 family phage major capsid protein
MSKLLKKILALMAQGYASKEAKAELSALVKEAGEEAETVAEEIAVVEKLPEEAPTPVVEKEEDLKVEVEKAFSSVEKKLSGKLDMSVKEMKADIEAFAKTLATKKSAKPSISVDAVAFKDFASKVTKGQKAEFTIELKDVDFAKVKTVGDISIDGNITGELPQAELDARVSRDPQRQPFIEQLITVGTIGSNLDAWIETTGEEGAPLPVAELAKLPAKDYDFVRRTAEVKKIGVYTKYSAEMSEDLPNLVSEIRNFLVADLKRVVDVQLLNGDGEYDELIGILKNAVAYSSGSFAGTILSANRFDVIETAVSQVVTALHNPNYVVVHPTDMAKMNLSKGTDGHYVLPPFITAGGQTISGVRVISNTGITAGYFLVGDFTKDTAKYKRGLTIEMTNTDQDDFVKDRFTVKATVRLVNRVRENDYEAFVYGNFDTAIASLELAS